MKRIRLINVYIFSLILFISTGKSQDLSNLELIAHYPLSSTANDTTGNYAPMELMNTPFQDKSIYCNGIYPDGNPNACDAITPDISALDFKSFAVSAVFKIDTLSDRRPILVCGGLYVWSIIFTEYSDSTISLSQRGALFGAHTSGTRFSLGTWHEITFMYESTKSMGWLYLDGTAIDSSNLPLDHGNDKTFSITFGGEGMAFMGNLKDLKIYSAVETPTLLQQDSLALVALYNSTDGHNWKNSNNWLTGPVDSWYGITVEKGRVIKVDLDYNNLNGTIPPEIGNLTSVKRVYLHDNYLFGTIPSEIGDLAEVDYLYLSQNQLEGEIPSEFGNLKNLNDLYLRQNNLTGAIPSEFANLFAMSGGLYLDNNQLTGTIPAEFGNFKELLFLFLNDNQFEGAIPAELVNMDALRYLTIQNNCFSDLPDLSGMASLERLRVQGNRLTFDDLEPNMNIATFSYSPQDSVGIARDTTVTEGTTLNLSANVGGMANHYQWYQDEVEITDSDSCVLSIQNVALSNSGLYTCHIINTIVPALTLYMRAVSVHVTDVSAAPYSKNEIPGTFTLFQNYPNPFNPKTRIDFYLPVPSEVRLRIYDVRGQVVRELIQDKRPAGFHSVIWDSRNRYGRRVSAGIYFCRIETNIRQSTEKHKVSKMMLIQ